MTLIQDYLKANPYQAPKPQPKKPSGNLLTHLIPTVGGTGGAIGGAAVGAAAGSVIPVLGTAAGGLVGALLGGALGGGGGKVAENAIEHQKLSNGVAGQAVEQGVLGAGPLRLAKTATFGTKAAIDVAAGKQGLEDALAAANNKISTSVTRNAGKNLVNQGQAAQGRVAGVSAGTKIANKELSPQDTKAMLDTLKNEGISTGNGNNMFRDLQDKLNQYGQQISNHFTTNNTPLAAKDVNSLKKEFLASLKTSDPTINKQANILATDLKNNVTDTKSLWQFRKQLDTMIPDAKQGMDNTGAAKTIALKNMRQFISQKLGNVPGASNYHNLSEIRPFVSAEARRLNNPSGGIIGRVAASGPVQKVEQLAGRTAESLGNKLAGNPAEGTIPGLTPGAIATRTVPLGLAQATASSQTQAAPPESTPQPGPTNPNDLIGALLASQSQQQPESQSPYSQDALMYDIANDPKHAEQYITTYKNLDSIFNPTSSTTSPVGKPSAQQYSLATSALGSIHNISNMIQQDPNIVNKDAAPGQGLPLVGGFISHAAGTSDYHTQLANISQAILHLQTGAAFSDAEKKAVQANLPRAGDSAEAIQSKLTTLYSFLSPFLQSQQNQSNGGDLTSALMQSGYLQ